MASELTCGEHHVHGPDCYADRAEDWRRHMAWCRARCEIGAWHAAIQIEPPWIFCPICGRQIRSLDDAAAAPAPALAEWYEPDGSVTMLPAEEVTRRRKLAAKVIGAARAVDESAFQHEGFGTWEVPDQDISDLCAALAALDAPAPEVPFADALRRFHAPTCATHAGGECNCVTWDGGPSTVEGDAKLPANAGEGTT